MPAPILIFAGAILAGAGSTIGATLVGETLRTIKRGVYYGIAVNSIYKELEEKTTFENVLKNAVGIEPETLQNIKYKGKEAYNNASKFLGFLRSYLTKSTLDAGFAGIFEPYAQAFVTSIYNAYSWSFGLGWLSWVAMAPILQYTVANPMESALRYHFRPRELTKDELEKAYARGYISFEQYQEGLRILGYKEEHLDALQSTLIDEIVSGKMETLLRSGKITKEEIEEKLKKMKFAGKQIEYIIKNLYKLPSEDTLEKMYLLGIIDLVTYEQYLRFLGYDENDIKRKEKLLVYELLSGNTKKLVELGILTVDKVKEKLEELGYNVDEATLFAKKAKKEIPLSYIDDILINFPQYENEIFRNLIERGFTEEDARLIISAIKARKREKERDLTKSDIRELFTFGIINESEAKNMLRALGYDESEVQLLISIWKMKESLKNKKVERNLAKTDILKALKFGLVSEDEAKDMLKNIGYDDAEIEILINILKKSLEKEPKERKREIAKNDIVKAYRAGIIDRNDAINMLISLGYSNKDAELILSASSYKTIRERNLTIAQLEQAFRIGIIDLETVKEYLRDLGFDENEIEWIIKTRFERERYDWRKAIDELKQRIDMLNKIKQNLTFDENKKLIDSLIAEAQRQIDLINALQDNAIIIKRPDNRFAIYTSF